jgi:hypothetical protein
MIRGGVVMSALIRGGVVMMAEPSPSPDALQAGERKERGVIR